MTESPDKAAPHVLRDYTHTHTQAGPCCRPEADRFVRTRRSKGALEGSTSSPEPHTPDLRERFFRLRVVDDAVEFL